MRWPWPGGWPPDKLLWYWLHRIVGRLAWRFARPSGPQWGIAMRINHRHPLWRLNDWVAGHWTEWWVRR